jgi:hypothetical protein
MKNISKYVLGILVIAAAAATTQAQLKSSGLLTGTWDVVVTPRVCATGDAITVFQATYIFEPGGNFSGVSSGTGSGGRGREQQGVWEHITGNLYRFKIKTYLFNAAGVATSYQIVTHDAYMSRDRQSWSSVGDSRTYTLDDIQINAGCSTIEASRVEPD